MTKSWVSSVDVSLWEAVLPPEVLRLPAELGRVDALWPSEVPESGRAALHSHVFRLRGHLGPAAARLETREDGYRLALEADDLDVAQART